MGECLQLNLELSINFCKSFTIFAEDPYPITIRAISLLGLLSTKLIIDMALHKVGQGLIQNFAKFCLQLYLSFVYSLNQLIWSQ